MSSERAIHSGAGAPRGEQQSQVSAIGGSVAVEVRTSSGTPSCKHHAEVRTVDYTVAIKVTGTWVDACGHRNEEVINASFRS